MTFKKIYGDGFIFKGKDRLCAVESNWKGKRWESQFEYLKTRLEQQTARGYYWLTTINISTKNQVVVSLDKFSDLNPATNDSPWLILGIIWRSASKMRS